MTDFFSGSPFVVEVERDLSTQQQLLDVVIVCRRRGKLTETLPDGLGDLAEHNLITFKSHREALDDWAIRELLAHYVAYRKLVSPSPSELLSADRFRLYAVAARFPHNLAGQAPGQEQQEGVYDCRWGLDTIRVLVAGQLPREAHSSTLQLFSASPELIAFGQGTYRRRLEETSLLLGQLFERFQEEGFAMPFTMEDFKRQLFREHFKKLTPEERREAVELPPEEREKLLQSLPPEALLAVLSPEQVLASLSAEQIRQYLDQLTRAGPTTARKPRRKK